VTRERLALLRRLYETKVDFGELINLAEAAMDMRAAIVKYIKRHEGHGPSAMDPADIHWHLYEEDVEMFRRVLKQWPR